jgi:hypothetical protein
VDNAKTKFAQILKDLEASLEKKKVKEEYVEKAPVEAVQEE